MNKAIKYLLGKDRGANNHTDIVEDLFRLLSAAVTFPQYTSKVFALHCWGLVAQKIGSTIPLFIRPRKLFLICTCVLGSLQSPLK